MGDIVHRIAGTLFATLALAACGSSDEVEGRSDVVTVETVQPSPASETVDPTPTGADADANAAIPARFHGTWDWHQGECDPKSPNIMTVRGDRIDFNGAVGMVTEVRARGNATLVDLALSDEQESWTATQRLSLNKEGDQLTMSEPEGAARDIDLHRRCPTG